jgi:hypothetical protein
MAGDWNEKQGDIDMWDKFRKANRLCDQYREALEDLPSDVDQPMASSSLSNSLPAEVLEHARECNACEEAAEIFGASRELLAGSLELAREWNSVATSEAKPWFAARVMAKIAEREMEGRRALAEWSGAVAKLASRLAWVSALLLLVGTTWFYGPHGGQLNSESVESKAQATQQYLFDSAAGQGTVDDALVSPPEK